VWVGYTRRGEWAAKLAWGSPIGKVRTVWMGILMELVVSAHPS
jgi:hypothetical protein